MKVETLYRLLRTRLGRKLTGWIFTHMSFAIPVQRLRETSTLLAFYHPQPAYRVRILLMPKRAIESLEKLKPEDQDFLKDLFEGVQSLVGELKLGEGGYRLVVNGGKFQEFPLLHFHLIAE